jgi:energy-converting hydrogenase Eha subunit E
MNTILTILASSATEGVRSAKPSGVPSDLFGAGGILTDVTNILLFVAGALAVIMIIVGGLRYVVSGGNSSSVTSAKNTVLYAIVGLIIAFLAFAAVNFLLGVLSPGAEAGWTDA